MQNVNEYLFLCTRIKSLERSLLNRERMERMLEARSNEDALDVLTECGYAELPEPTAQSIDRVLADQRRKAMADLAVYVPDPEVINAFRVRYDYHNVKVLLKSEAMSADPASLLLDAGRVSARELTDRMRSNNLAGLPSILQTAIMQAREVLNTTADPQQADFVLDRAFYADMDDIARRAGSGFLGGYVRISVDAANLRSVVRTLRMGKDTDFLKGVLFEGGNIDVGRVLASVTSGVSLDELFASSPLREAAEEALQVLSGGPLTRFEKLCDEAVTEYLSGAKYIAFGEAPIIAYLAAKETEFTAVRIIMAGRMAGLDADTIRERLREAYV